MESTARIAGSRMEALERRLDAVANNIANADTPGFKRTVSSFRSVLKATEGEQGPGAGTVSIGTLRVDFSQGALRNTGRKLDVALRGDGFLAVDTPQGRRYTRRGRIYANARGELVDVDGNYFSTENSGALSLPNEGSELAITRSGEVQVDGETIGQLLVVAPSDPSLLKPQGSGLFRVDERGAMRPDPDTEVIQGAIEGSNANPVNELVTLIQVSRSYEAAAKAMKRLDEASGQLIRTGA